MVKKRMVTVDSKGDIHVSAPPSPPRRQSSVTQNRVGFGLRINADLLDKLRAMADDAGIISMNEYVCFVLRDHVGHYEKQPSKGVTQ
jgi:predicted HicB family RNase H-like nuclease